MCPSPLLSSPFRRLGAQLGGRVDLVGRPRDAAQREEAQALGTGLQPSLLTRPDANDHVGVERDLLAGDRERAGAAQRHVDLLLPGLGVVVLGVALGQVRWEVEDLHPERRDPELGTRLLERAPEARLHVVDALRRVVGHARQRAMLCAWTPPTTRSGARTRPRAARTRRSPRASTARWGTRRPSSTSAPAPGPTSR